MPRVSVNVVGLAQDADHQVDHVAAQLEHDAAGIFGQPLRSASADDLAHDRMDLEHIAEPALLEELPQDDDAGL